MSENIVAFQDSQSELGAPRINILPRLLAKSRKPLLNDNGQVLALGALLDPLRPIPGLSQYN
jgi:hypothetical protein